MSLARTSNITLAGVRKSLIFIATLVRGPQAIADAGLCQNIVRSGRVGLNLASKLSHIDAKMLGVYGHRPKLVKQEFVGEHLSGVLNHDAQQLIFLG